MHQNEMEESKDIGILNHLINDSKVKEVLINNHQNIMIRQSYSEEIEHLSIKFESKEDLLHAVNMIIMPFGKRLDQSSPIVNQTLTNGSRIRAAITSISNSLIISIKKPQSLLLPNEPFKELNSQVGSE
jgi:Flp pilus assembly protein, ATPase CpaF